jgi:hypothetical protein
LEELASLAAALLAWEWLEVPACVTLLTSAWRAALVPASGLTWRPAWLALFVSPAKAALANKNGVNPTINEVCKYLNEIMGSASTIGRMTLKLQEGWGPPAADYRYFFFFLLSSPSFSLSQAITVAETAITTVVLTAKTILFTITCYLLRLWHPDRGQPNRAPQLLLTSRPFC